MNKPSTTRQQRFPRRGIAERSYLAVLLAIALAGCDNFKFGGIQVKVHEPTFARSDTADRAADTVSAAQPLILPAGPVVFHVRRLDATGRAIIEPVGELAGGGLRQLGPRRTDRVDAYAAEYNARYYQPDQAYLLFRDQSRVGTFYVRAPIEAASDICPLLQAEGHVELQPRADTLSEFLAWPPGARAGGDGYEAPATREDMAALAQVLAQRGVRERGIAGVWRIGAPTDLRALRVGTGPLGLAATFMVGDSLGRGSPAGSAGMVFLVADFASSRGYFPIYFDAAWYGPGEKRAVRWVGTADLTGDSDPEWLLKVYGDAVSWYEVVGQQDRARTVLWSSRLPHCEAREPAAADVSG